MCGHTFYASTCPAFIFHLLTTVLSFSLSLEVGAAEQVYLIQTTIWSGNSRRAGKLAISLKNTIHRECQTSAFKIQSTISALKLLWYNITKVQTPSLVGGGVICLFNLKNIKSHILKNHFAVKEN